MPNEESHIPGNENDLLLLQLVSALINPGQPPGLQPALSAQIPVPQQLNTLSRPAIPPPCGFPGYGATLGLHIAGQGPTRLQQQHPQQLPYVGSSVDFEASGTYADSEYDDREPSNALEKRERVRLKNRLAQQRFRERRRTLQRQAQDQFDTMAAEIDALEIENDALREEEQALSKLYYVKTYFWKGMLAIENSPTNTRKESNSNIKAGMEEGKHVEAVKLDFKDGTGGGAAKQTGSTSQKLYGIAPRENALGASSLQQQPPSLPQMPAMSLQTDSIRTTLFASLQAWQLELSELMEKVASLGFPADEVKILEAAAQRQLEEWQHLARGNSCKYAKLLQHLLAPLGIQSPNNSALEAGTVGHETLAAVVLGITDDGILELQKAKTIYETNVDLGRKAFDELKKELLPLLILSCSHEVDDTTTNVPSTRNNARSTTPSWTCYHDLAARHVMAGAGIAHLHALKLKLDEAIRLIGPAWSRVAGPLSAALCHLETAPYLPTPDVMVESILAKHNSNLQEKLAE